MGKPNPNAPLWGHMERTLHKGEVPRTRFIDMEDAKKVTVLTWPGMHDGLRRSRPEIPYPIDELSHLTDANAAVSFAKTCHATEPMDIAPHETLGQVMEAAAGGSLLWQVAETLNYSLRLEGLTRVLSHQMVRARVGWSFSETCTGDHDWRHGDFLVPRAWMRNAWMLEQRLQHLLLSKHFYACDIDGIADFESDVGDGIPGGSPDRGRVFVHDRGQPPEFAEVMYEPGVPNDARYILHPNLKVFVHARTNLAALREWYAKRSCTMTQAWEMVVLAERVKAAVLAVTPWAAKAFQSPCETGKCWYLGAYKQPLAMANYYQPDELHAKYMDDWNPASFLSKGTHYQMSSGPTPFSTREYHGYDLVR